MTFLGEDTHLESWINSAYLVDGSFLHISASRIFNLKVPEGDARGRGAVSRLCIFWEVSWSCARELCKETSVCRFNRNRPKTHSNRNKEATKESTLRTYITP